MSWILWVVFTFNDGSNLKYPLEAFDMQDRCVSASRAAQAQYDRATPRLFPEDHNNITITTHCLGASRI